MRHTTYHRHRQFRTNGHICTDATDWCTSISDQIRYLTMTDASKVWMPDTFFRWKYFIVSTWFLSQCLIINHTQPKSNVYLYICAQPGMRKQDGFTRSLPLISTSGFSQTEMFSTGAWSQCYCSQSHQQSHHDVIMIITIHRVRIDPKGYRNHLLHHP